MSDEDIINQTDFIRYTLPCTDISINFERCSVEIMSCESPSSFYLRKLNCRDYYHSLFANMKEHYFEVDIDSGLSPTDIPLGSYWCVKIDEWAFRAKVMKINAPSSYQENFGFEMFLVDFGMTKTADIFQIQCLDDLFVLDPPWALHCSLAQVYPLDPWQPEPWDKTSQCFKNWWESSEQLDAIFVGEFQGIQHDIVLENEKEEIINELLVQKGVASSKLLTKFKEEEVKSKHVGRKVRQITPSDLNKGDLLDDWNPMKSDFESSLNNEYYDNECAELVLGGVESQNVAKLCKFYSKGKVCPRGDDCRWLHFRERDDGLPTEYEETLCFLKDEVELPKENTVVPLIVANISSPSQFYAYFPRRSYEDRDQLKLMGMELSEVYHNSTAKVARSLKAPGELVIVKTQMKMLLDAGLQWWRARVLDTVGEKLQVFYIDIGIRDTVDQMQIRDLHNRFLSPGPMAVSCELSEIKPLQNMWCNEARMTFGEFVNNCILHAYIVEVSSDEKVSVALFKPEDEEKSINEILVEFHLAQWNIPNMEMIDNEFRKLKIAVDDDRNWNQNQSKAVNEEQKVELIWNSSSSAAEDGKG